MGNDDQGSAGRTDDHAPTHLFLVRVWEAQSGAQTREWCGRVQHVLRGEAYSFVGWETLKQYLEAMMARRAPRADHDADPDATEAPQSS